MNLWLQIMFLMVIRYRKLLPEPVLITVATESVVGYFSLTSVIDR
jgi:hypothetical protein